MGIFTVLEHHDLEAILAPYGLVLRHAEGVFAGTVNTYYCLDTDKGVFYLRIDERGDEAAVQDELALLEALRTLSVPLPVRTRNNELWVHCEKKPAILFTALPGAPIPVEELGKAELTQIGNWLTRLHSVPIPASLPLHRFHPKRLFEIYTHIAAESKKRAPEATRLIDELIAKGSDWYRFAALPERVIHADLFSENLHFSDHKLVGVLDFEAAGRGPRLLDLAITIQALCFDLHKNRFDRVKATALSKAYLQHISPSEEEKNAWPELLRYSALRFLITRLKDFEFSNIEPHEGLWKDYREYLAHFADLSSLHRMLG